MASGSIRKRGDAWQVRVYLGVDPVTGRKKWAERTVHGGLRQAEKVRNRLLADAAGGSPTEGTFGYLVAQWLAVATLSPSTMAAHRIYLDKHILPVLSLVRLDRLKPVDLDRLYSKLLTGGLSPSSVHKAHTIISSALAQGVRWNWLPANPAERARPPQPVRAPIRPPEPAEVRQLFDLAREKNPDLLLYLRLAAATGARRGELVALRWSDVDLEGRAVNIVRTIVHGTRTTEVRKQTKTKRGGRPVDLDAGTAALLTAHLAAARARAKACHAVLPADAYLFALDVVGAQPWRPDGATSRFMRLRRQAGISGVRLHDLRHFAATQQIDAGVPLPIVSGRLGHARVSTTSDIYAHWIAASGQAAADTMGDVLDGVSSRPS